MVPTHVKRVEDIGLKPSGPNKPPDPGYSELDALRPGLIEKEPFVTQVLWQMEAPREGVVDGASLECSAVPLTEPVSSMSFGISDEL